MRYSEKFIKKCNKNDLNFALDNCQSVLKVRFDKLSYNNSNIEAAKLMNAISLDQYVCQLMTNGIHNHKINDYIKEVYQFVMKNPLLINEFPIFNLKEEILTNYITKESLEKLKIVRDKALNEVKDYYKAFDKHFETEAYKNNPLKIPYVDKNGTKRNLNNQEWTKMIKYFLSSLPAKSPELYTRQDKLFKYLFNIAMQNQSSLLEIDIEYIYKFMFYKEMRKNSQDAMLKEANIDYNETMFLYAKLPKKTTKGSARGSVFVVMNANCISPSIKDKLRTVPHECRHIVQSAFLENGSFNNVGIESGISKILRDYYGVDFDEYHVNYWNYEIEHDANIAGHKRAAEYLKEYCGKESLSLYQRQEEEYQKKLLQNNLTYRKTQQHKVMDACKFKFTSLDEAMMKNPNYLKQYPQFNEFYNNDGTAKSFFDVLANIDNRKFLLLDSVGKEFIQARISNAQIENLQKYPPEQKKNIFRRLSHCSYLLYAQLKTFNSNFDFIAEKLKEPGKAAKDETYLKIMYKKSVSIRKQFEMLVNIGTKILEEIPELYNDDSFLNFVTNVKNTNKHIKSLNEKLENKVKKEGIKIEEADELVEKITRRSK